MAEIEKSQVRDGGQSYEELHQSAPERSYDATRCVVTSGLQMSATDQLTPMHRTTQDPTSNSVALRRGLCRLCHAPLTTSFIDLGMSPLCESFLTADQIDQMEPYYPLHVLVCGECFLVQLQEYVKPEHIFQRICVFFVVFDILGRACAPVLRNDQGSACVLVRRARCLRSQATTDICFSTSCRWVFL